MQHFLSKSEFRVQNIPKGTLILEIDSPKASSTAEKGQLRVETKGKIERRI